jgi:hypothetical protein
MGTGSTGARSLYEVLGVSTSAGGDEVRRAYLDRAREAHPDRHIDASGAHRADVERRMREVNEAWRVLGNPRRRRRYDLERAPERMFVSRSDGTMPSDVLLSVDEIDGTARLIRGLPWMILVFVLFAIFVFTAYAATGGGKTTPIPSNNLARCVEVGAGPTVASAACGAPGARLVVAQVDTNQPCPVGSERLQPATGPVVYCLAV